MIAGPLLEKLGYPLHDTADEIRPSRPATFTPDEAKRMIERAKHPFFKDKLKKGVHTIYRTVFH
jgi:hypothetical protein